MKKLILSGGGSEKDSKILDKFLIDLIPKGRKMLYIPIAMETYTYEQCYKWVKSVFSNFNFNSIVMYTDLRDKKFINLKNIGAVYIGGGNSFKLLHELNISGFDKVLIDFINNGGIVYGGSAGAIILGKDIRTAAYFDKNKVALKHFSGLNTVNNYSIWCHYKKIHDKKILEYLKKFKIPVIALSEKTGVFVDNDKIKVIGFEPIYVFKNNRKISFNPNDIFA